MVSPSVALENFWGVHSLRPDGDGQGVGVRVGVKAGVWVAVGARVSVESGVAALRGGSLARVKSGVAALRVAVGICGGGRVKVGVGRGVGVGRKQEQLLTNSAAKILNQGRKDRHTS